MTPASKQPRRPTLYRCSAAWGTLLGSVLLSSTAYSLSFNLGEETTLDIDTSLNYTAQWRLQSASGYRLNPSVNGLEPLESGLLQFEAANNDDGNRNFDTGMTSNRLNVVVDMDLNWRNYGVFLRGRAYYDSVYVNRRTAMDALGYQTYNGGNAACCLGGNIGGDTALGDFPDETVDIHGRRIELLDHFAYGTFDLPGYRVLELRLGSQVINWGETTIAPGINGLQNRFDAIAGNTAGAELKEIFLPTGAFYGQLDLTEQLTFEAYYQYQWIENRLNGVGSFFGGTTTPDFLGPGSQNLLIPFGNAPDGSINVLAVAPQTPDDEPSSQGQWGSALHYFTNGGTDFGLYFVNGHDKSPSVIRNGELIPDSYTVRYFDNIHGAAASFTSVWGRTNVQGEATHFTNTPIADADGVAQRMPVTKLNLGGSWVATPTFLWDDLNLVFEVAGVAANGKVSNDLQFDAAAWGYFLRAESAYKNVLQGLDINVPITFQHNVDGTFKGASAFYVEGSKVLSIAAQSIYLNRYIAQLTYTSYFDGGLENLLVDRDNITLNLKYSF